ncbi:MAG: hypothetical protein Unbinned6284contig1004_17 [Prokaryotic dsDNA virus sp.]|nr:MAG: hypothetical protein Unbinned6284contig1004_17 [Prokaryotic dsDNA virus sp.]
MNSRYDELNQLIKYWSGYIKLRRRVYKGYHMPQAWYNRLDKIQIRIDNWKLEKDLLCEL